MAINIKALRDQRAEKAKEARNLLDTKTGADFTKEVETQIDGLYAEIDRIDAQIDRAEKQAKIDGDDAARDQRQDLNARHRAGLTVDQREQDDRYSAAFHGFLVRARPG